MARANSRWNGRAKNGPPFTTTLDVTGKPSLASAHRSASCCSWGIGQLRESDLPPTRSRIGNRSHPDGTSGTRTRRSIRCVPDDRYQRTEPQIRTAGTASRSRHSLCRAVSRSGLPCGERYPRLRRALRRSGGWTGVRIAVCRTQSRGSTSCWSRRNYRRKHVASAVFGSR